MSEESLHESTGGAVGQTYVSFLCQVDRSACNWESASESEKEKRGSIGFNLFRKSPCDRDILDRSRLPLPQPVERLIRELAEVRNCDSVLAFGRVSFYGHHVRFRLYLYSCSIIKYCDLCAAWVSNDWKTHKSGRIGVPCPMCILQLQILILGSNRLCHFNLQHLECAPRSTDHQSNKLQS